MVVAVCLDKGLASREKGNRARRDGEVEVA